MRRGQWYAVAILAALFDFGGLRGAQLRERLPRALAERLAALRGVYPIQPHADLLLADQHSECGAVGYFDHAPGEIGERGARPDGEKETPSHLPQQRVAALSG
jgi:hypothetical protein